MKTGIYKITNIISGKMYIGSALNIDKRWSEHKRALKRGDHRNIHLQRAWDKYGESIFVFEIVEQTKPEDLIVREQYHIDVFKAANGLYGYNISPTAGNSLGIKRSEETKNKVRMALLGSNLTEDHKKNISEGMKNSQKYKDAMASPEFLKKMRDANLGKKNPMYGKYGKDHHRSRKVLQYTKEYIFVKEWDSMHDIIRELKFSSHANIVSCCKGRLQSAYGFIWKYKD